jgi:hypothetical protein
VVLRTDNAASVWGRRFFLTAGKTARRKTDMKSKEFEYNGKRYRIEKHTGGKIMVFEHLGGERFEHRYGEQKRIIVNKLAECIQATPGADFDSKIVKYVNGHIAGTNRSASQTTRSLGKVLFDHLL